MGFGGGWSEVQEVSGKGSIYAELLISRTLVGRGCGAGYLRPKEQHEERPRGRGKPGEERARGTFVDQQESLESSWHQT